MNTARTLVLVLLLPLILTTAVQAITLKGSRSCGQWVAARAGTNDIERLATEAWLVGYLSGLAMAYQEDTLNGIDNESLFLWTDNYCKESPLNRLAQSGQILHGDLNKKRARR